MDWNAGWTVAVVVVLLALVFFLVFAIVKLVRLLQLWRLVKDPAMPMAGKVTFWAALVYAFSPIDVLPDPIYLDDVGVLVAAATVITRLAAKRGLLRKDTDPPP